MKLAVKNGVTSLVLRVLILDSASTTGAGKTGLTSASTGLIISTIADNEATPTVYAVASSNVETITTLGTFAAPTASKCRFKEVDATNHPGLYELHIADARWAVSNARSVIVTISGASGAAQVSLEMQLENVPANVQQFGGSNGTFASGRPEVNASHWGGTAIASANVRANLTQILGTAPTEGGAGRLAASLTTLLDVASPVLTAASVNQTGDSFARIGATGNGLTSLAPSATALSTATWTATRAGYIDNLSGGAVALASGVAVASVAADAITSSALASSAASEIAAAVWDLTTTGHTTGGTFGAAMNAAGSAGDPWSTALPGAYAAGTAGYIVGTNLNATVSSRLATASYTAPLDAAGTRSAVGLAFANLDTQLTTLDDFLDTEIAAIKAKTDNLPAAPAATGDIPSATTIADAILSRNVSNVEATAPEHSLCTIILASLESSISGTTWTIKRTNGSTTHATKTVTVDAAADPITGVT